MARKNSKPNWDEARRRCRLDDDDVRMAKELGMSPSGLVKNIPSKSQQWKSPVREWIRELYSKRFPEKSTSPTFPLPMAPEEFDELLDEPNEFDELEELEEQAFGYATRRGLTQKKVDNQNDYLLRRQREFRQAAEYVSRKLATFPVVKRVVLIGSVASPLKKEVPRFSQYRRAGIAVWHECKDVDLAVWLSDLSDLKKLQRARGQALNGLLAETGIGVAHHQVEVFLMEPGTDRYLGRLCTFGECPKGKPECRVPGCGATKFLQLHEHFRWRPGNLDKEVSVVLFERNEDAAEAIPF